MMKSFATLLGLPPKPAAAVDLEPHRTNVEFAFVLVEAESDQQTAWTVGSVTEEAIAFKGMVLQIVGSLVFVAFSGVVGLQAPSQRKDFAAHIVQKHRVLVRILHGQASALVGNLGGPLRRSYTVVPDNLGKILTELGRLAPGEAKEHVVQQSAHLRGGFAAAQVSAAFGRRSNPVPSAASVVQWRCRAHVVREVT